LAGSEREPRIEKNKTKKANPFSFLVLSFLALVARLQHFPCCYYYYDDDDDDGDDDDGRYGRASE